MSLIFNIFLFLHIASGFIAFVAAPLALMVKKGGQKHRLFGRVFFYAMNVLCPSAFIMSIINPNMFLFMVSGFSYYLVLSGYRWLYRKKGDTEKRIPLADAILLIGAGLFNASLLTFGVSVIVRHPLNYFGYIACVFGLIGMVFVFTNYRQFKNPSKVRYAWILNHAGGMVGGYIATVSAFSVVNLHFLPELIRWLWASVIGVPILIIWIRRYKAKLEKQGTKHLTVKNGLIILLCCYSTLQARQISGTVMTDSRIALQYVSVGVKATPYGTVTDNKGHFCFNIHEINNEDSLQFSILGFIPMTICLRDFIDKGDTVIILNESPVPMPGAIVTYANIRKKTFGNSNTNTKMKVNFSIPAEENRNLGSEIGRRFNITGRSVLKKFRFFISRNNYDTVVFRVNVYGIKALRPSENINRENIIYTVYNKQTGWMEVDLSPYKISTSKDVVVSIEWIGGSKKGDRLALPITVPSILATHYYKFGSRNKWKTFLNMSTCMMLEIWH